jgi:hypothetical protein
MPDTWPPRRLSTMRPAACQMGELGSIYPIAVGRGKPFLREGQNANLRLVTTKSFSKGIVKLTYEPR